MPGLCNGVEGVVRLPVWRFTCRAAPAIAVALRRLARLRDAPAHWLFAGRRRHLRTSHIAPCSAARSLAAIPLRAHRGRHRAQVRPGAVPPGEGSRAAGRGTTARPDGVFPPHGPARAARAFRRGAWRRRPVPRGRRGSADGAGKPGCRARRLLGVDVVVFQGVGLRLRRAYWYTAARQRLRAARRRASGVKRVRAGRRGHVRSRAVSAEPSRRFRHSHASAFASQFRTMTPSASDANPLRRLARRRARTGARLGPAVRRFLLRLVAAYPHEEALPASSSCDSGSDRLRMCCVRLRSRSSTRCSSASTPAAGLRADRADRLGLRCRVWCRRVSKAGARTRSETSITERSDSGLRPDARHREVRGTQSPARARRTGTARRSSSGSSRAEGSSSDRTRLVGSPAPRR